ncbi:MAG TPA: hypothetical protein DD727_07955, partial [Clostridiales bacterium]|nr:hypothetical protein [Clostridiales bacterium]
MSLSRKTLSVVLIFLLIFLPFLSSCSLFQGGGAVKTAAEKPVFPSRPYVLLKQDTELTDPSTYLSRKQVSVEELLNFPELEQKILNATSLEQLADSSGEVKNLTLLWDDMKSLIGRINGLADRNSYGELTGRMNALVTKIDGLVAAGRISLDSIKAMTALKGTWTTPDRILLRWSPQKEWVPDNGYNLYRVLDGITELLAEGLGSQAWIDKVSLRDAEFAQVFKPAMDKTRVTAKVLQGAGVATEEAFNALVYKEAVPALSRFRFTGTEDYQRNKDYTFGVTETLKERLPFTDAYAGTVLHVKSQIRALPIALHDLSVLKTTAVTAAASAPATAAATNATTSALTT